MIVVRVELWPRGDKSKARHLGTAHIANDGTGTKDVGNYRIQLYDKGGRRWKRGALTGFKRQRWLAWDLVMLCLVSLLGDRHGGKPATTEDRQGSEKP